MRMLKSSLVIVLYVICITSFSQKNYNCYRSSEKIIIDGNVYKDAWLKVPWSDFFIDIEGDAIPLPYYQTRVKMLYDSVYLYIAAEMEEQHIWGYLENRDDIIYRDNDFEVFIDPLGSGDSYFEVEINALGTIMDLYLTKPYNKGGKADLSWNASELQKAVKIYGSLNDSTQKDIKWTIEMAIPWDAYKSRVESIEPPANGDVWRMNFSRVEWESEFVNGKYTPETDTKTGKKLPEHNWVWSPQGEINMHLPERWGFVTFIDELPPVNYNIWTQDGYPKFWVWMGGNTKNNEADWEEVFRLLDDAGIKGFLYGGNNALLSKVIRIAKQYDIKTHAWFWTMNRGDANKEWLSYNQLGKSLADEKAYVDYYKFMCPALPEVKSFIKSKVDELLKVDGLEGIHMDYIRYVDVILPIGLQPKYGLVQDRIMPEFDYGYHPYMRGLFAEEYGIDPLKLDNPGYDSIWIDFRLKQLNQTVEEVRQYVKDNNGKITAAVFPTPEMSADMVRQDWKNWKLDCYFPMVYHNFYNEDINWITTVINTGKESVGGNSRIFCGLYLPALSKENDLELAIKAAYNGGADGVSFFSYGGLNQKTISQIKKFTRAF